LWKRQNRDAFSTLRRETFRASTRERKKERKKERKNSLELFLDEGDRRCRRPRRRLVRDPLFFFVVEAKRHPRDGDPVFSALFFLRNFSLEKQNRERKNNMEWKKKTKRLSFCVF
tara:strand:+ start:4026 stop:4370 length:345 start_codon:yes stop_codon:yes gene_type:complete